MNKKHIAAYFGAVLTAILAFVLIYSCAASPGSSSSSANSTGNNLKLKLKVYMGSASPGDFISYSIDNESNRLIFSNITRDYDWSAGFTIAADSSRHLPFRC
jgi:hypothetical protein